MNHEILSFPILIVLMVGLIFSKNWLHSLKKEVFLTFLVSLFLVGTMMIVRTATDYKKPVQSTEWYSIAKNCRDDKCDPPTKPPRT